MLVQLAGVTLTGFLFGATSGNCGQRFDLTNSSTYTVNFIADFGGGPIIAGGGEDTFIAKLSP